MHSGVPPFPARDPPASGQACADSGRLPQARPRAESPLSGPEGQGGQRLGPGPTGRFNLLAGLERPGHGRPGQKAVHRPSPFVLSGDTGPEHQARFHPELPDGLEFPGPALCRRPAGVGIQAGWLQSRGHARGDPPDSPGRHLQCEEGLLRGPARPQIRGRRRRGRRPGREALEERPGDVRRGHGLEVRPPPGRGPGGQPETPAHPRPERPEHGRARAQEPPGDRPQAPRGDPGRAELPGFLGRRGCGHGRGAGQPARARTAQIPADDRRRDAQIRQGRLSAGARLGRPADVLVEQAELRLRQLGELLFGQPRPVHSDLRRIRERRPGRRVPGRTQAAGLQSEGRDRDG